MKKCLFLFVAALCMQFGASAQSGFGIKYGPYLQNVGENEVSVVWVTTKNALGWVEVAPDDQTHFYAEARTQYFQTENGRKVVGTLHRVTIKGLEKGTKYRYRIYAREVVDNNHWDTTFGRVAASNPSRTFGFTTLNGAGNEASFAVVNDIHADTAALAKLLNQIDLKAADFIVFNGDMMNHLNSEELMFNGFVNKSVSIFASDIPFFMTRGNHETRGPFSTRYMEYFPTSTGKPYYTFRQGPAFFIMLDSAEDKPDTDIEYGGLSAFDAYREEQAEWLKRVVASEEFKQAPVRIVFVHIPAFTSTWHGTLHVQKLFIPILNEAGIDLMISGHTHRYGYFAKGEKGNNFPMLINANREIVDVKVVGKSISVTIKDREGKVKQRFDF